MATQQVNVRLEDDFVEELKQLAERYNFKSHNELARDLLETYLPMWVELQEAKSEFLMQQRGRAEQQKGRVLHTEKRRVG